MLLAEVHRVAQLVIENLVSIELCLRDELQLACEVRDRRGVSVKNHLNKGCPVTLTIVETLTDEDSGTNVDVRGLKYQLNILHRLKLIHLGLASRFDSHQLILQVLTEQTLDKDASLLNSLNLDVAVGLDGLDSVGVLGVKSVLQQNCKDEFFILTEHLFKRQSIISLAETTDRVDERLLVGVEDVSCIFNELGSVRLSLQSL